MITVILGLPGAGKSYLAEKVAKEYNALYLNSDKIRKESTNEVDYTDISKTTVYESMFAFLEKAVSQGGHVVVDATFYRKPLREKMIKISEETNIPIYFIEVVASVRAIQERLKKQRTYSDANFKTYQQIKEKFDPLEIPHLTLRSDRLSITEMLRQVKEYIVDNATSNEN